ncbi:hypothetical protein ANANG_G00235100 [Anguilla anguilla]|uniref:Uncharacterized protein n=1 Tax=Anguilla anguilla TaxID=7936 RepID=A0A9D3RNP5_ANGAN|nr:hypothetical protein ANANG_G00235100 [Anguilla anguilla]
MLCHWQSPASVTGAVGWPRPPTGYEASRSGPSRRLSGGASVPGARPRPPWPHSTAEAWLPPCCPAWPSGGGGSSAGGPVH